MPRYAVTFTGRAAHTIAAMPEVVVDDLIELGQVIAKHTAPEGRSHLFEIQLGDHAGVVRHDFGSTSEITFVIDQKDY